jgi:hypothetical protein
VVQKPAERPSVFLLSTYYCLLSTVYSGFGKSCLYMGLIWPMEERINAVKRLAVSTGQLKWLPTLHTPPIDLVVFQEPSFKERET